MFKHLKVNIRTVADGVVIKHDMLRSWRACFASIISFALSAKRRFEFLSLRQTANKTCYFVLLLTAFCQFSVHAEKLHDPTAPPGQGNSVTKPIGTKAAPHWILTSTLIATDRRLANINGTMVAVGNQVAGAEVTAIEPDYVRLRKGDKELVLELLPRNMKQVAKGTQP